VSKQTRCKLKTYECVVGKLVSVYLKVLNLPLDLDCIELYLFSYCGTLTFKHLFTLYRCLHSWSLCLCGIPNIQREPTCPI